MAPSTLPYGAAPAESRDDHGEDDHGQSPDETGPALRARATRFTGGMLWLYIRTLIRLAGWRVGMSLGLSLAVVLTEGLGLVLPLLQIAGLEVGQGAMGAA